MNRLTAACLLVVTAGTVFGAAGCNGNPANRAAPRATDYSTASADPSASGTDSASPETASPSPGESDAASPSPGAGTATPSDGVTPGGETTPGAGGSPGTKGDPQPSGAQPASCTEVNPVRVLETTAQPRRATEVVSAVSDGNNVESGTRTQSDFTTPVLTSPLNTELTDGPTLAKVASLVGGSGKIKVLTTRPAAPDEKIDPDKRPFNQPGTYVLYNASAVLTATVVVQCSGQEQNWKYTVESGPVSGQVNCAVEPKKSNSLALSVYSSNC